MQHKKEIIYFILFLLILFVSFFSLLVNINKNLIDWFDYPLITWIVFQNIEKIKDLQFSNFFDTNAFYPYKNTLFLSDTFIPQSLISLPFTFITQNNILIVNILFFFTFILNYISSSMFWKRVFKSSLIGFIGAVITVFSPFTHLQLSHFQMLNFWPFFFGAYFLLKEGKISPWRDSFYVGIFLSLQFLASVYLSIFFVLFIVIYILGKVISLSTKNDELKKLGIIFLTFFLIDGIFIKGYIDTKNIYSVKRNIGEYIQYSAHLSDYLFPLSYKSIFYDLPFFKNWSTFNKHVIGEVGSFPGFTLWVLSSLSIFQIFKKEKITYLAVKFSRERIFFLGLIIFGLAFSLGPRLSFNGQYAHIPTPYLFILKLPLIDAVRALARWNFLFYIGLIYFALDFIHRSILSSNGKVRLFIFPILILIFLEYIPWNFPTHSEQYITPEYTFLKDSCQERKKVLLEIPVTHYDTKGGVVEGLNYISKTELSSIYHNCLLVNGYSGYDIPQIQKLKDEFYKYSNSTSEDGLIKLLKDNKVEYLKYNKDKVNEDNEASATAILKSLTNKGKLELLLSNIYVIK